jgi:hypothetical protein
MNSRSIEQEAIQQSLYRTGKQVPLSVGTYTGAADAECVNYSGMATNFL